MNNKNKLYPKFETEGKGFFNQIKKVEHPFLQQLVDMNAAVIFMGNEFTVYGCDLVGVLLFIYDDSVELECISTDPAKRKNGQATEMMKALIEVSNRTNIPITLRTANVTGNGWQMMQHPVVALGMNKKNKIPTAKLKGFYEKFGFKVIEKVKAGYRMIYTPVIVTRREVNS